MSYESLGYFVGIFQTAPIRIYSGGFVINVHRTVLQIRYGTPVK